MIKIVLITSDNKKIKLIRNSICHIDMHLFYNISFFNYKNNNDYKKELCEQDHEKIFLIDLDDYKYTLKIAKYIRKYDKNSRIIFISCKKELLDKYYNEINNVYTYLLFDNKFTKILINNIKEIIIHQLDDEVFSYTNKFTSINICYKKILYIYRDTYKRKTVIVTTNNRYMLNIALKDIKLLLDNRFIRCHRACILNKLRVNNYYWNKGYFELDNGSRVYLLSKKYKINIF